MAVLVLLLGLFLVAGAFVTNTAPNGTHNLGLLQQQMMTLHVGLALLIISAIRWTPAHAREEKYAPDAAPARVRKSKAVYSPPIDPETGEPVVYERPTGGLDKQQQVIAAAIIALVLICIYVAVKS